MRKKIEIEIFCDEELLREKDIQESHNSESENEATFLSNEEMEETVRELFDTPETREGFVRIEKVSVTDIP